MERQKKIIRKVILLGIPIFLIPVMILAALIASYLQTQYAAVSYKIEEEEAAKEYVSGAKLPLSPYVEMYREEVYTVAEFYGIREYTDLLLAIMMQESGGLCKDVFQCSESLGKPRNSIGTTESINRGCQLMAGYLAAAQVESPSDIEHIKIALQAYNFGGGFINYINKHGGTWSQEIVNEFAKEKSGGRRNTGAARERLGEWKYGDQYYTEHVLRYYAYGYEDCGDISQIELNQRMTWLFPEGIPNSSQEMTSYLTTVTVPIMDSSGNSSTMQLTVHRKVAASVVAAFTEIKNSGFPIRNGDTAAYCWRNMVSGNNISAHSYGIAIDVNWNSNPMEKKTSGKYRPGEDPYSVTPEVVAIFEKYGFYWGGNWKSSKDYMHFSYTNK